VRKLSPNEYNPKAMTKEEHDKLQESIEDFGMVEPIVVNKAKGRENIIIGGHQRWQIHKELGIEKIPVVYVDIPDIAAEQEINLRLTKNTGHTDWDLLANISEESIKNAGYDEKEIETMLASAYGSEDKVADDKAPELPKAATTKKGQLFKLGNHRLLCGDSTSEKDCEILMAGAQADIVFTDPPYNVNYKGTKFDVILNDNQTEEEFVKFTLAFMARIKENLKVGGVYYVCSGYSSYPIFLYAIRQVGMLFSNPIVWVKNNTSMGWNDYRYKHEMVLTGKTRKRELKATPIMYGWNQGRHYFKDTRFEADVWEMKRKAGSGMVHPTQKPIGLINRALANSSQANENVLDLFAGSGSTMISAEMMRRNCFCMELDPKFCDVIIERWENFTGNKAVKL